MQAGAHVLLNAAVECVTAPRAAAAPFRVQLRDARTDEPTELAAAAVVNSCGLSAHALARRVTGLSAEHVPAVFFAKGNYFTAGGPTPFSHLVYPLPEEGGLGAHVTLDLAGGFKFGPDVQWLEGRSDADRVDYRVDARRAAAFSKSIATFWPAASQRALHPAYSGVRPKLSGPGQPPADWVVASGAHHGVPGLVNLFGIESPGLTACLALAEETARALR